MKRRKAEQGGRRAERLAAWWLRLKGWHILAMRARTPVGEIDLIARRGRTLAFIEVKARATEAGAAIALDEYRLRRVVRRRSFASALHARRRHCPDRCNVRDAMAPPAAYDQRVGHLKSEDSARRFVELRKKR